MLQPEFITRTRKLPSAGHVDVKIGQWVNATQTVAHVDYLPGRLQRFAAGRELVVSGKEMPKYITVAEGDKVEAGQTIGAAYAFGELRTAVAPVGGYVGLISRALGYVYFREPIPVSGGEPVVLDIAEELKLSQFSVGEAIKVRIGQTLIPEQVVAVKRALPHNQLVLSPIYGKATEIKKGRVTITPLYAKTELNAYVSGKVIDTDNGTSVTIQAYAYVIPGLYGVGGERGGELLIAGGADEELGVDVVSENWAGKVVVVGRTASLELIQRAAEAGVAALIMAHLSLDNVLQYTGGKTTMGLTGDEEVPATLILTEGFLPSPVAQRTWNTLSRLQDRYATVNGVTHIRAGVIRPEIIVCELEWPEEIQAGVPTKREVVEGSRVQLLRNPRRGAIGVVRELPVQRERLQTEAQVRVAVVDIDGELLRLPVSNLLLLERGGQNDC